MILIYFVISTIRKLKLFYCFLINSIDLPKNFCKKNYYLLTPFHIFIFC
uniref:Uncharacterized protein n=1 Tax=Herposiphonia versicolor TaxID=2007163 RepID=A0A1Z1MFV3_9FLOR|nr:hypothetical protein [Herposiphonia versicolor]ARW64752.1 hypothetical protein [Herposiphonia versicolor]